MPFLLLAIGGVLALVAIRGTHAQLGAALEQDMPRFFIWGAALGLVGAVGFVPGMRRPSMWLLGLVVLVLVVSHYKQLFGGVVGVVQGGVPAPTQAPADAQLAALQVSATGGAAVLPASLPGSQGGLPFDPQSISQIFNLNQGFGGGPFSDI